ncbi:hypothetical protein LTR70_007125 [Exophiala xenobiotica]|uniref:Major facilitator superfamily (MFS) profile domain-containing protein n=1 Tax=Lithohypha guttulata TaxID=1690604 RepID=A0ABR0K6A5_9EURO|nr:hypothetical protein LTR24_006322 [Lithohypha guttulata]KAK5314496.1 hypothetical protein LTR70_007125 [Exophiala xenobiotica]
MAAEPEKPSSVGDDTLGPTRGTSPSRRSESTLPSSSSHEAKLDSDVENGVPVRDTTEDADEKAPIERVVSASTGNVVDWNDPSDPRRPINWTTKKKWINCAIISILTFLTPLASSMVAPAVPLMMADFKSTNSTLASFIVSIYILGYAIGPLFIAPLSEILSSLLAFRLLAGVAGSCPITIFAGSIADVFIQEKRGGAMAICALGPLIGPVVGPVAGGFLAVAAGWRWVYWVITIAGGVTAAFSITFQRETYEPILLQRLTNKLKKETGNDKLRSKLDRGIAKKELITRAIVRPTKMLIFSPIVLALSVYMAIVYGYLYLLFTTLTPVYQDIYGFGAGPVGLVFLGIGIGSLLGLVLFGTFSDRLLKRLTARNGTGEMKPEYRLPPLIPGSLFIPIGFFWYGWSVEKQVHWIMGIIGTLWVGFGMLATFMPIQTYLVDAFTIHAASAIAANTVLRSLVGAFLPLAGPKMYATLGLGWGNSLLAFIALLVSPVAWIFFRYGEAIRKKYAVEF